MNLTKKQRKVLEFIIRYKRSEKIAPTLREIGDHLNVSPVTVYEHLVALENKGAIRRSKHKSRAVELLIPEDDILPSPPEALIDPINVDVSKLSSQLPDTADLREVFRGQIVALRADKDRISDDAVRDGDFILIEPHGKVKDGELVLVSLQDGKLGIRKYKKESDTVRLEATGPGHKTEYSADPKLHGVFVGIIRNTHSSGI